MSHSGKVNKPPQLPDLDLKNSNKLGSKYLLIIGIVAVIARILYFISEINSPLFLYPVIDEKEFVDNALQIARSHFNFPWYYWHPPGYSYFLAVLFSIGFSLKTVVITQYAMGVAGSLLVYLSLRKFDKKAAFIASVIWAVYPLELFTETRFLSENMFTFLLILLIWFILNFEKKNNWFIVAGLLSSLLIVTKSQFLLFVLLAVPLLLFYEKVSFRKVAIYLAFALLLPMMASFHNSRKTGGNFIFVSANGPVNLYIGNSADIKKTLNIRPVEWREKFFPGLYDEAGIKIFKSDADSGETFPYKLSSFLVHKTIRESSNLSTLVKNIFIKTFILLHSDETPRNYDIYQYRKINPYLAATIFKKPLRFPLALFFYAALLFIILNFKKLFKDKKQIWLILLIFIVLLPSLLFFNAFRYRLTAIPFLLFFAVLFYRDYLKNIRIQLINVSLVVVFGTGIFQNLLIQKIPLFETFECYGDGFAKKKLPLKAGKYYNLAVAVSSEDTGFTQGKYQLLMNMGVEKQETGDNQSAMDYYSRASELKKDEFKPYLYLADIKSLIGENEISIGLYTKVINNPATDEVSLQKSFYNRGLCKAKINDLKGAMGDMDKSLAIDTANAKAFSDRGVIKARLGDAPGALKDFNQAIRLSPSDKKAWFNRAGIKAGSGDIKGAIEDLDKAIGLDPQNSDAFLMRGIMKIQNGMQNEGCIDLKQSAGLGNQNAIGQIKSLCK